ncbi:hypothetical protein DBQ68_03590 [Lactobacillus sp. DS15_6]|nr:hypothetical protein [Lacticaseibacillus paracasei]PTS47112.1 hypothetical protein DBQ69_02570 [Lactobacillus sp. DS1_6]PTS50318.1 hypothetical protein DBQ60_08105 [Lactobacillus sp. DS2_6]PTS52250.1 hypothetical protein DBQ62_02595 [Lactobacillus sp. DS9_6]PTS64407.1 hypothetical protein DBQ68_03590 [Lactobacillus sp. DS15_6]PTS70953.1 hypothetical protein DBQ65_04635 [Lactobacillus sp. DS3_6]PTV39347.1 hypothetical protein DB344_08230 [Lactobacillus sp. DS13_6]PTV42800.1 hypothetical pr
MQTTQRRFLELMSLGSKRRHSVPAPAGRRLRSLARQGNFSLASSYDYSEFNESQVL